MALQPGFVGQDTNLRGIVWPSIRQTSEIQITGSNYFVLFEINKRILPLLGLVSFRAPLLVLTTGTDSSPFAIIRLVRSYTGPGMAKKGGKG